MKHFFIIILFIPSFLVAQKNTGSIRAKVIITDGSSAFVTVELKKLKKRTLTDINGNFILNHLPALQDTLVITSAETKTYMRPVTLPGNEALNLGNIHLVLIIGQLQDVEVRGRTIQSYKSDYTFLGTKTQTALTDIPQSISSITKEMIEDKMKLTLKDVADEAAGVNQYSGYDEYAIRGFRAENASMINGLRGYNSTFTSPMLVNVERIEVLKGPSAVLYGNCDPGGTINLVTKKPLSDNEGDIRIAGGSWNHFRTQMDVTGPINKNKSLLYRFNTGYDNTHSFRDLFYAKSYEIAPSFSFVPNNRIQFNVDFSLSHINTILDRGQPGFADDVTLKSTPVSFTTSQPGDFLHETDIASNLLFSYKLNKNINFNSGYLNYITQQNVAGHGLQSYITADSVNLYYSTWNYHTVTHTLTDYFTFRFNTGKLNHQLLAGYDYISSSVNLDQQYFEQAGQFGAGSGIVGTFSLKNPKYMSRPTHTYQPSDYNSDSTNVEGSVYHTHGIYVQEQVSLNKWKALLGLRQIGYVAGGEDDTENPKQNIFLPRIGLTYSVTPCISLYGTYNRGFDPYEVSTSTQVFNEPFKPVTSELIEAGAKANVFNNKLSTSLSIYQLTIRNVAVNANDISNPNLFIQQGKDRSRGLEAEANGNILSNLSISVAYSYSIAKVLQSKIASQVGSLVENAPKNTSNSWIKYTFNKGILKGVGIVAGHEQVSERNTVDKDIILPGYLVLNCGVRYAWKHLSLALNLDNITNRNYWIGAYNNVKKWPGATRNFMISAGYRW